MEPCAGSTASVQTYEGFIHVTVTQVQHLRVQSDFLESDSLSSDFVLGFVHHSIRPLSDLLHLLKRVHLYKAMAGLLVI